MFDDTSIDCLAECGRFKCADHHTQFEEKLSSTYAVPKRKPDLFFLGFLFANA